MRAYINECKTCGCKNKLRCVVNCEKYKKEMLKRAFNYNAAVSGDPNIYGQDGTVWEPRKGRA